METTKLGTPSETSKADEQYMRRCISLALNGEGRVSPNPMVGAVVVCDGRIVGEGWHRKAGTPHAEVHAIGSVRDEGLLRRSTLYVSLEPCSHFGKTPPCADLIVAKGIPEVVIGCVDSFSEVSGRGIAKLREAGVRVRVGVLEEECRWLNRRFFTFHEKGRPYVILKWAQTGDGSLGVWGEGGPMPLRISDERDSREVHKLRTTEDGILVGVGTVLSDDPSLTARLWPGRQPVRFVVDPDLRAQEGAKLFSAQNGRTVVLNKHVSSDLGRLKRVRVDLGGDDDIWAILKAVHAEGVQSLIVEGGAQTLRRFLASGLYDETRVFVGGKVVRDGAGVVLRNGLPDSGPGLRWD